eukprot:TRINITY_DN5179_c0_g2_i1.p1 TRINITY_DN5179_c0_g2~~TRINITY_DN5179_c0_g2_i1.p1  ORF type:complete len:722 (+),score=61.75 TRINITY_DN5179_c0_g2_i1:249-2414(+)
MWRSRADRAGNLDASASGYVIPREFLLRRLRQRKANIRCAFTAIVASVLNVATLSGIAHLAAVACVCIQITCLHFYLRQYVSVYTSLTVFVEFPLLLHLLWYWRAESAARAAPTQWVVYSWLHAAKVVVLYCKVMPRLATVETEGSGRVGVFGATEIAFGSFFTPPNLTNLLLLTPVFYALLMLRTSNGIFGSFSGKITVDVLMHFDMLWHVVIDMVDQVDMFSYARLSISESVFRKYQNTLTFIQTVIPFLLFLSILLQAQSLPGVIVDRWRLPNPPLATGGRSPAKPLAGQASAEFPISRRSRLQTPALHLIKDSCLEIETGSSELNPSTSVTGFPSPGGPLADAAANAAATTVVDSDAKVATTEGCREGDTAIRPPFSSKEGTGRHAQSKEKQRRRRLTAIVHNIHRQSILISRKRSAVVSIFFVDLPFLTLRIALWILISKEGSSDLPALSVKNGVCILLNILQYTLVRVVNRDFFEDIQRRLAIYRCCHCPSAAVLTDDSNSHRCDVAPASGGVTQMSESQSRTKESANVAPEAVRMQPSSRVDSPSVSAVAVSIGPSSPAAVASGTDKRPGAAVVSTVISGVAETARGRERNTDCGETGAHRASAIEPLSVSAFGSPDPSDGNASHFSATPLGLLAESPMFLGQESPGGHGAFREVRAAERDMRDAQDLVRRETVRSPSVCVHFWALLVAYLLGYLLAKGEPVLQMALRYFNELF